MLYDGDVGNRGACSEEKDNVDSYLDKANEWTLA